MQEDNPPRNELAFNGISVGFLALPSDGRLLPTLNDSEIYCARVERFSFAPLHGGLKKKAASLPSVHICRIDMFQRIAYFLT